MIIKLGLPGVLYGFAAHFTKAPIDAHVVKRSWNRVASYTTGLTLFIPYGCLFYYRALILDGVPKPQARWYAFLCGVCLFAAAVAMGIGTVIGWAVWDGAE